MKLSAVAAQLAEYCVVLEPDENTPEWWAGAPSVVRTEDGTFYLAARMREGNSPKGRRGYEVRILKSCDGRAFETIHRIKREDAGVPGFERPALVQDPVTGQFKLYGCAGLDAGWAILKWDDADTPAQFDPRSARPVVRVERTHALSTGMEGFKDPVVFWDGGRWHMFVIGFDRIERIHHFVSADGLAWEAKPAPVMENDGWHNFYLRPASVVPMRFGYLFVYEGSHFSWHDPIYNIATGVAYTPDLETFIDLTPHAPLLTSTTPGDYHTWRYSHWLPVGNQVFVYFEAARPNNTNEIRLSILDTASLG
jgi:hypothetical protein